MRKTIAKETVREYDKDGKLVGETVTETTETDDTPYTYYVPGHCMKPELVRDTIGNVVSPTRGPDGVR